MGGDENKVRNTIDSLARTPLSQVLYFVIGWTVLRLLMHSYLVKTDPHKRTGGYSVARFLNEFADAIVYAGVFVFMLIRPFVVQTFTIPSGSMLDTLQINDFILANKAVYRYSDPKPGDIVVFKPPQHALMEGQGDTDFIKRCIGAPGDLIEIKEGELYRNGQKVDEPYFTLKDPATGKISRDFKLVKYKGEFWPVTLSDGSTNSEFGRTAEPYFAYDTVTQDILRNAPAEKIPPGHYLMFGDNREGSYDSRGWGLVKRDWIIAKSMVIWLPLNRIGPTK